jgi:ATP-grasp domain
LKSPKRPAVLLAATVWWPAAARLAIRLIGYGCRVAAVCPRGHVLTHVRGLERIYFYDRLSSLNSLELALRAEASDFLVPCDDRAVWQLHELYDWRPDLRPLIESSLGAPAGYRIIRRRERLLEVARGLGIRVPDTLTVRSERDVSHWFTRFSSAVLKLDDTWGGNGVKIVRSEAEAIAGYRQLTRPSGFVTTCKRLVVNQDPLALWEWTRRTKSAIAIQRLIEGRPANAMIACWQGEVLGMVTVEVLASQGATGAALVVRAIENDDVGVAAQRLVERLGLTGFCGLDFMIESSTGRFFLIEMNPRCTQLGHLALGKTYDLAGLIFARLTNQDSPPPRLAIENEVVAFFPQTEVWTPQSSFLRTGYHDVPREDPSLLRELLLDPWPDRQWRARLYHLLKPSAQVAAIEFASPEDQEQPTDKAHGTS